MVKNIQHIFRLILPLLCALFFLDAQASLQQPVQVTAVMIPPYGNYLSDYYAGTEERMSVTLLNRDVMQPEIRVKLRLTIRTSSGTTLTTKPEAYFPPIVLESNVPQRLTMAELAPYFSKGNLNNANALTNETLPEGFCQFSVEAVEYYTGRLLSSKTTAVAFLQFLKPAKLISPTNKENVLFQEPLNLTFRWQPVTSSGYGAPEYEFTLKEIDDKQANVEAAFLYARMVYQTTTKSTLLPYTADLPMLENGKRYAWQIKASLPIETKNRFQNNGYSEVWYFELREDCKPPIGLTAEPTHDMMLLKWQPAQGAASYNIQYRREDFDSNIWHDKETESTNSIIDDIAKGHSYVFRVGTVCEDGNTVYGTEKTVFMPLQDEKQNANCGKEPDIDLSNREPKEYLGIGDVFYCADYPVTITEVTGGNGIFSGKGYAPFPLFGALPVNVTFSNVSINADSRMTEGSVTAVRDEGNSLMSNLDRLTEGGTQKLAQGIIKPDIIVDYAIPPTATLTYDSIADTYTIEDENHQPIGNLQMPKNDQGEPVFPVIVKDADENIYRIEETKDESGAKKGGFTFTPLGRQMDPTDFGGIRKDVCDWDYGVVVFTESPNTKYALDEALPYYDDCAIIRCHADAQKENGGRLYNAYASINNVEICSKWKFMAAGETDEVLAAIDIRNDGLEPGKVLFANAQGVIFPSVYDAKKKTYTITLTGSEANTVMTVYALYKAKDGYKSLGYMHVDTRAKMPQQSVVIVNATGKALKEDIAATLNAIYSKVGVTWNVTALDDFSYPKEELSQFFDEKSSLISQYNDAQKAVIAAFEDYLGDRYDSHTSYVFLFAASASNSRDVAGFMPRGRQYCFIDTKKAGDLGATIAHELGHGRFNLKHPFDDCYGRAAKDSRGTTPLLMDYTDGTSIAKWQWSEIYQPALIGAVFEREERGEMSIDDITKLVNLYEQMCQKNKNTLFLAMQGSKCDIEPTVIPALVKPHSDFDILYNTVLVYKGITAVATIFTKNEHNDLNIESNIGNKEDFETLLKTKFTKDDFLDIYTLNNDDIVKLRSCDNYGELKQMVCSWGETLTSEQMENYYLVLLQKLVVCEAKNIMLFVNGYRGPLEDNKETDNNISLSSDRYDYWDGIDKMFIERRHPDYVYYADGHMSISTSNHIDKMRFATSMLSSYCVKYSITLEDTSSPIPNEAYGYIDKANIPTSPCYSVECVKNPDCVHLNETPNTDGFDRRKKNGRTAGATFVSKMQELGIANGDTLDIVCHSMGFAYAQGMIEVIKQYYPNVHFGGYYIIAPENACSGTVNLNDWDEIWQYGSDEEKMKNNGTPWLLDGVAPQCQINGLKRENRAFIPDDVPQGFVESHTIKNYKWIFITKRGKEGYVTPR